MKKIILNLTPLFIYGILSFCFFGLHLLPNFHHYCFGMSSDALTGIWNFNWWPFAILHGLNPFFTSYLWAPVGYNLTQTLPAPLIGILLSPLTLTIGPLVTFNLISIFASALSAYAAYYLCRYLTHSYWVGLFGGYLFGFSSYEIAQSLAHLCLSMTLFIPLLILLIFLYFRHKINPIFFVVFFGLLLVGEFLINTETYVVISLFLGCSLVIAYFIYKDYRQQILIFTELLVGAYFLSICLVSPYIYSFLSDRSVNYTKDIINYGSMDLFNLFIPTSITWIGGNFFIPIVSRHFHVNLFLSGAYLGLPLITIIILYFKEFWHTKLAKLLFWMLIIIIAAALGPILHWRGHKLVHMPWALVSYVPILKDIIPARFTVYLALTSAIIGALWLRYSTHSLTLKITLAVLTVLFLLPNPSPNNARWVSPINIPDFIHEKTYKTILPAGGIVMALPYDKDEAAEPMVWQVIADMYFKLSYGSTGGVPKPFLKMPIIHALLAEDISSITPRQFQLFLKKTQIDVIMVKESLYPQWAPLLAKLKSQPVHDGGIVYVKLH